MGGRQWEVLVANGLVRSRGGEERETHLGGGLDGRRGSKGSDNVREADCVYVECVRETNKRK